MNLQTRSGIVCHTLGVIAALLLSSVACAESLLVVRKSGDAIDFIDPGSGQRLATVAVGYAPHEVAVSPDGRQAVVSNYGSRERPGSSLSLIDLEHPAELRRIDLSPHQRPHGVAWFAADRVAVTAEASKSLLIVEPSTGRMIAAIDTGQDISHMVAVAADGRHAYVANIGSGTTTAIDIAAGSKLRDLATGEGSEGLALSPDGRELWVGARAVGEIAVVDTESGHVLERLSLPGIPIRLAMTPDGERVLVSCAGSSELVMFERKTRRELARRKVDVPLAAAAAERPFAKLAPGSALPVGLALARDGRSVYVAATMADRILRYDIERLDPLAIIEVEGEPDGMGVTESLPQAPCHGCADTPAK